MFNQIMFDLIFSQLPLDAIAIELSEIELQKQRFRESDFFEDLFKFFSKSCVKYPGLFSAKHDAHNFQVISQFVEENFISLPIFSSLIPFILQIIQGRETDKRVKRSILHQFKRELQQRKPVPPHDQYDQRYYNEVSAADRFLTYFSSLLKMNKSLSACTAVCLAAVADTDALQLYISCNVSDSKPETPKRIRHIIFLRLQIIQACIEEIKREPAKIHLLSEPSVEEGLALEERDETEADVALPVEPASCLLLDEERILANHARLLLVRLGFKHKEGINDKTMHMATKIVYTLCFDDRHKILSPRQKAAFADLMQAILILPRLNDGDSPADDKRLSADLFLRPKEEEDPGASTSLELFSLHKIFKHNQTIRYIHAEQLLLIVLANVAQQTDAVGVSLLCCFTCAKVVKSFNVRFYGGHQKAFPGVIDLHRMVVQSPHLSSMLHFKSSPVVSPLPALEAPLDGVEGGGEGAASGPVSRTVFSRLEFDPELCSGIFPGSTQFTSPRPDGSVADAGAGGPWSGERSFFFQGGAASCHPAPVHERPTSPGT